MTIPAAREPGPLVTLVRSRTVANVDSIVIWSAGRDSCCDLQVCVVEGVHDVPGDRYWSAVSTARLLPKCDALVRGVGRCRRGVGQGRTRVGGVAAGSRRRVRG